MWKYPSLTIFQQLLRALNDAVYFSFPSPFSSITLRSFYINTFCDCCWIIIMFWMYYSKYFQSVSVVCWWFVAGVLFWLILVF